MADRGPGLNAGPRDAPADNERDRREGGATTGDDAMTKITPSNAGTFTTAVAKVDTAAAIGPRRMPARTGLYDPRNEHDACGVGFIAQMKNVKSHSIIEKGLQILENLTHRGAVGADPDMGDGAGMLVQIPHRLFAEEMARQGVELPEPGHYGVGHIFMPRDAERRAHVEAVFEEVAREEGQSVLGWRDVPVSNEKLSKAPEIVATEPVHRQIFIARASSIATDEEFQRKLFILRKVVSNRIQAETGGEDIGFYVVSLSMRTIVYKGMFLAYQLGAYYADLKDERFESAMALVHQRFSTNTFPSWKLAHPYRMVAHNGEINTLRGNVNWMAARQASVDSELFGNDISKLWPISYEGQSDTACFDNALEFLHQGGYPLVHAMMMLIPEAWAGNKQMPKETRAFYEYHAALMEPWDGPAAVAFTDGRQIGATLDRNGLRPARYVVTDDDLVVMASEAGTLPIDEERVVAKWRLQPGRMLLIDLEKGRIVADEEIKREMAGANPYREWLKNTQIILEDLKPVAPRASRSDVSLLDRQQAFGYTIEDTRTLMAPMATTGQEAIGSMGTDTPISAMSDKPQLLYTYFKQNFAQVTNPPIDPIREELVMSLVSFIGPRPNIFDLEGSSRRKRLEVRQPILTNGDLEKIRYIGHTEDRFDTKTIDITYGAEAGAAGMAGAVERLCERAEAAVAGGYNIIILSDRQVGPDRIPIPALLATAAVHHHLIRKGLQDLGRPRRRKRRAARGASLRLPRRLRRRGDQPVSRLRRAARHAPQGRVPARGRPQRGRHPLHQVDRQGHHEGDVQDGHLDLPVLLRRPDLRRRRPEVGLRRALLHRHRDDHRGRRAGGGRARDRRAPRAGLLRRPDPAALARDRRRLRLPHARREPHLVARRGGDAAARRAHRVLGEVPGLRQDGERGGGRRTRPSAACSASARPRRPAASRSRSTRSSRPRDIVKRFCTGAMSFGSISTRGAHDAGARHEPDRRQVEHRRGRRGAGPLHAAAGRHAQSRALGDQAGRLGPLRRDDGISRQRRHAADQGGAGRQARRGRPAARPQGRRDDRQDAPLDPGRRPDLAAAAPRHLLDRGSGAADLRSEERQSGRPTSRSSWSRRSAVGTVAAGVAKARADHVIIAGYDGGTGASPLTSIKHAGSPWEMGLAETQQTLVMNGLRSRICLQVDGGIRTGRDVIVGALLGADEFGFATAPLIAAGCIMMRKCHLNTCPVGVATQDPVLRKRFKGAPEHVINYFFYVAEEVRLIMAELGVRHLSELIGQSQLLDRAGDDRALEGARASTSPGCSSSRRRPRTRSSGPSARSIRSTTSSTAG